VTAEPGFGLISVNFHPAIWRFPLFMQAPLDLELIFQ
jgi:hypothetical protein